MIKNFTDMAMRSITPVLLINKVDPEVIPYNLPTATIAPSNTANVNVISASFQSSSY